MLPAINFLIFSVAVVILSPVIITVAIGVIAGILILITFSIGIAMMVWESLCNMFEKIKYKLRKKEIGDTLCSMTF